MFSVYDLTCNGLKDPCDVEGVPKLAWRLGSDTNGADQHTYRIVVTSLSDGMCRWDTGIVVSDANEVSYEGESLAPGEICVWFVMATCTTGERADSVPASFGMAACDNQAALEGNRPNVGQPTCGQTNVDAGSKRRGFVWTSDEALNERANAVDIGACPHDAIWRHVVGLALDPADDRHLLVRPHLTKEGVQDLSFAQGSMLMSRGLVVVRWERKGLRARLQVAIPPGMHATLQLADLCQEVASGRYELVGRVY